MRILHLSDLHFGARHFFRKSPEDLALSIATCSEVGDVDLIVLSGDLTWAARTAEFNDAARFTRRITHELKAPGLVVPGNHDVDLSDRFAARSPSAATGRATRTMTSSQRVAAYQSFLRDAGLRPNSTTFPAWRDTSVTPAERVIMKREGPGWFAVGVNSAARLCELNANTSYPIAISSLVLYALDQLMRSRSQSADDEVRIFVLHHHLLPVSDRNWGSTEEDERLLGVSPDPSIISNSGQLQDWLAEYGFHLVLHGHKHVAHGRVDRSWSSKAANGRDIVIMGAGSAGVEKAHRPTDEPLSFNVVELDRLAAPDVRVLSRTLEIKTTNGRLSIQPTYGFDATLHRDQSRAVARVFHGRDSVICHALIHRDRQPDVLLRNFISVVDHHEFKHPPTLTWKGQPADRELVFNSFQALQPHLAADTASNVSQVRYSRGTRGLKLHYHLEHGKRLFSSQYGLPSSSPFLGALQALRGNSDQNRRSYVGLFRTEIDSLEEAHEPPPGLVGLQFVIETGTPERLSIVASFRYIELSFWWGVNMLEAQHLLASAHRDAGFERPIELGSITFFAALARWESSPELVARAALDTIHSEKLTEVVVRAVASGDRSAAKELSKMLEQKIELTSARNIDSFGLDEMAGLIAGLLKARIAPGRGRQSWTVIAQKLQLAVHRLDAAVRTDPGAKAPAIRAALVDEANEELAEALARLESIAR